MARKLRGSLLLIPLSMALFIFYPGIMKWISLGARDHSSNHSAELTRVWVSKQSGFYYCADMREYGKVQPGSFMTQTDAIQTGYRSVSGITCR